MKKRVVLIALTLMCALLLCGAACDHEWESQGPSSARCSKCALEVSGEDAEELILQQNLEGHWEFALDIGQLFLFLTEETDVSTTNHVHFYFDGMGHGYSRSFGDVLGEFTYEFTRCAPGSTESAEDYFFQVYTQSGEPFVELMLSVFDNGPPMLYTPAEEVMGIYFSWILSQYKDEANALEGRWICENEDGIFTLEFNEDRSLSGDMCGEADGWWQASVSAPFDDGFMGAGQYAFVTIGIGEEVVDAEIFAADAEIPMDEQRESCKLYLPLGDKEYIFTPLSGDEAA